MQLNVGHENGLDKKSNTDFDPNDENCRQRLIEPKRVKDKKLFGIDFAE